FFGPPSTSSFCYFSSVLFFCFFASVPHRAFHPFPARRSSDLAMTPFSALCGFRTPRRAAVILQGLETVLTDRLHALLEPVGQDGDRKSTRLNSSHVSISYAVFCLQKKK